MFETLTTQDTLAVLEKNTDGAWLYIPERNELHWSPRLCQNLGADIRPRSLDEVQALIHPADRQPHLDAINAITDEKQSEVHFSVRVTHRDGHALSIGFRAAALTTQGGQRLVSGVATLSDARRLAEGKAGEANGVANSRATHRAARNIDDMLALIHKRLGEATQESSPETRRDTLLQLLQVTFQARELCAELIRDNKPAPDLAKRAALNDFIAKSRAKLNAVNKFKSSTTIKSRAAQTAHRSEPRTPATPHADDLVGISLLVVDDTPQIFSVINRLLKRLNVKVFSASNARDALTRLEEGGIDVVLMDFAMPGMNGRTAALKMRERHPDLPIILSSGYSENKAPPDWPHFLSKPFSFDELVTSLQNARRAPLTATS